MAKTMNKILTRIRNPKVAVAVVSGVLLILVNLGLIDAVTQGKVMDVANTILSVGVAIGIFGNPESHVKEEAAE
jgi:uncharacterized membrane protein